MEGTKSRETKGPMPFLWPLIRKKCPTTETKGQKGRQTEKRLG